MGLRTIEGNGVINGTICGTVIDEDRGVILFGRDKDRGIVGMISLYVIRTRRPGDIIFAGELLRWNEGEAPVITGAARVDAADGPELGDAIDGIQGDGRIGWNIVTGVGIITFRGFRGYAEGAAAAAVLIANTEISRVWIVEEQICVESF